jgi:hypothetical protein
MKINFVLVASGNVMMQRLNIALMGDFPERAKVEAQRHVETLYKAGYFQFTLYDTQSETHFQIATFRLEEQEPKIIMS